VHAGLHGKKASQSSLPVLPEISAAELKGLLDAGACTVIDLGASMNFRKAHIPGSRWSIRPQVTAAARNAHGTVVLVAESSDTARLAAIDLAEAGVQDLRLLAGGLASWAKSGYSTESSPTTPPDSDCIDYLFFVHDRHAGNREAMKQYLSWETGLIAQLDQEDRALFKVGVAR
jgi:3-mercaptopyruvate sulfurtransferase SseA